MATSKFLSELDLIAGQRISQAGPTLEFRLQKDKELWGKYRRIKEEAIKMLEGKESYKKYS